MAILYEYKYAPRFPVAIIWYFSRSHSNCREYSKITFNFAQNKITCSFDTGTAMQINIIQPFVEHYQDCIIFFIFPSTSFMLSLHYAHFVDQRLSTLLRPGPIKFFQNIQCPNSKKKVYTHIIKVCECKICVEMQKGIGYHWVWEWWFWKGLGDSRADLVNL